MIINVLLDKVFKHNAFISAKMKTCNNYYSWSVISKLSMQNALYIWINRNYNKSSHVDAKVLIGVDSRNDLNKFLEYKGNPLLESTVCFLVYKLLI